MPPWCQGMLLQGLSNWIRKVPPPQLKGNYCHLAPPQPSFLTEPSPQRAGQRLVARDQQAEAMPSCSPPGLRSYSSCMAQTQLLPCLFLCQRNLSLSLCLQAKQCPCWIFLQTSSSISPLTPCLLFYAQERGSVQLSAHLESWKNSCQPGMHVPPRIGLAWCTCRLKTHTSKTWFEKKERAKMLVRLLWSDHFWTAFMGRTPTEALAPLQQPCSHLHLA